MWTGEKGKQNSNCVVQKHKTINYFSILKFKLNFAEADLSQIS